jgi:hypothetical protein
MADATWKKACGFGVTGVGVGTVSVAAPIQDVQVTFLGLTATGWGITAAVCASAYSILCVVVLVRKEFFGKGGEG